jgi:hypothetical protein
VIPSLSKPENCGKGTVFANEISIMMSVKIDFACYNSILINYLQSKINRAISEYSATRTTGGCRFMWPVRPYRKKNSYELGIITGEHVVVKMSAILVPYTAELIIGRYEFGILYCSMI